MDGWKKSVLNDTVKDGTICPGRSKRSANHTKTDRSASSGWQHDDVKEWEEDHRTTPELSLSPDPVGQRQSARRSLGDPVAISGRRPTFRVSVEEIAFASAPVELTRVAPCERDEVNLNCGENGGKESLGQRSRSAGFMLFSRGQWPSRWGRHRNRRILAVS